MMYLPPPQPALDREIRVSGDVEIHPTASIAPGVILQAAPQSRIVIGADACIGMGVIVNACQGMVEIGTGAILGSGVLIIGDCKIGNNSCIGTSTTVFNDSVAAMSVIEPGSIIGDASRRVEQLQENTQSGDRFQSKSTKSHFNGNNLNGNSSAAGYYSPRSQEPKRENQQEKKNQQELSTAIPEVETTVEPLVPKTKNPVVGQVYINELLVTLFPHKKGSDPDSQNLSK